MCRYDDEVQSTSTFEHDSRPPTVLLRARLNGEWWTGGRRAFPWISSFSHCETPGLWMNLSNVLRAPSSIAFVSLLSQADRSLQMIRVRSRAALLLALLV